MLCKLFTYCEKYPYMENDFGSLAPLYTQNHYIRKITLWIFFQKVNSLGVCRSFHHLGIYIPDFLTSGFISTASIKKFLKKQKWPFFDRLRLKHYISMEIKTHLEYYWCQTNLYKSKWLCYSIEKKYKHLTNPFHVFTTVILTCAYKGCWNWKVTLYAHTSN